MQRSHGRPIPASSPLHRSSVLASITVGKSWGSSIRLGTYISAPQYQILFESPDLPDVCLPRNLKTLIVERYTHVCTCVFEHEEKDDRCYLEGWISCLLELQKYKSTLRLQIRRVLHRWPSDPVLDWFFPGCIVQSNDVYADIDGPDSDDLL